MCGWREPTSYEPTWQAGSNSLCGPVVRGRVGNRDNAMETSVSSSSSVLSTKIPTTLSGVYCCSGSKATVHFPIRRSCENTSVQNARRTRRTRPIAAINDVQTVLDPAPVQVTWQIVVGAMGIAFGIIPNLHLELCLLWWLELNLAKEL
ncbi:uncharacterized protein LOC129318769 isoform X2 [Prosopis cineraria]|uniref:uncharacterized protein LOC129318769 isoform X2 n=1 Tax=Prosopis cineraria TaxID=364024 RepID=UPI00240F837A|nr:uncharacterized protein LOC129318769 isoform X2 [Prosopis cineraria]